MAEMCTLWLWYHQILILGKAWGSLKCSLILLFLYTSIVKKIKPNQNLVCLFANLSDSSNSLIFFSLIYER